ncbi:MAG: hypothetical protein PHV13_02300 [Candidatus ainarchaeum sp.]|nr:hypothetical protein [Candidatus ainarchaeum sp.]
MANGQKELKQETPIMQKLAPEVERQLGLQNVMNAIGVLYQQAGTVLAADASARLREAAAYMKGAGKAENYSTAWFGEQALRALNTGRVDIAMFAVNIGVGGGMSGLTEAEKRQLAGIITMETKPGQEMLGRLIVRLEITSTMANVESIRKDFGPGTAQRISRAATEAQRRFDANDLEGAETVIIMARMYMGLVMISKDAKWAGRTEMESGLDMEIARKDGGAKFAAGMDAYQLELQRQGMRLQLEYLGQNIQRMKEQNNQLGEAMQAGGAVRLLNLETRLMTLEAALNVMQSTADFERPMLVGKKKMPAFKDEYAALLSEMDYAMKISSASALVQRQSEMNAQDRRMAGGDKEVISCLQKSDAGLQSAQALLQEGKAEQAQKAFMSAMEMKAMALAFYSTPMKVGRPRGEDAELQMTKLAGFAKMAGELFGLLSGERPLDAEGAQGRANALERGMWILNAAVMSIPPRVNYSKEQNSVFRLVNDLKLDQAEAERRGMVRAAKDYIRVTNGIMMAAGIGAWFIPYVGPVVSTAVFAGMATDNIIQEYRANGRVSPQAWAWAAISVMPGVGWAGRGVKAVRVGSGTAMAGATAYATYNTAALYGAWMRETDPDRRHELLSDAVYGTIFLAPAALMAPAGYRYAKGAVREIGYAIQDMAAMPSRLQLQAAMQPIRIFGYGADKIPMERTPAGGFARGNAPLTTQEVVAETMQQMRGGGQRGPGILKKGWQGATNYGKNFINEAFGRTKKLEPPSAEEVGASAGRSISRMMDEQPQAMAPVAKQVYSMWKETKSVGCRQVLRTLYANENTRAVLEAAAQRDPEIAAALKEAVAGVTKRSYFPQLAEKARTGGVTGNEVLVISEALERHAAAVRTALEKRVLTPALQQEYAIAGRELRAEAGANAPVPEAAAIYARVAENNRPMAQTERALFGQMTATDRATLMLNLEGKATTVKLGKKKATVEIIESDHIVEQRLAAKARSAEIVERIPDAVGKVMPGSNESTAFASALQKGLREEIATAANLENALLSTLQRSEVTAAARGVGGDAAKIKAATSLDEAAAALPEQVQKVITGLRNSALSDNILAAQKLAERATAIGRAQEELSDLIASTKEKTIPEAMWDGAKRFAGTGWYLVRFANGKWMVKNPEGARFGVRLRGAPRQMAKVKNILPLFLTAFTWYTEGHWAKHGVVALYNTLTTAGSVEEGRKAAQERFGVTISAENARFVRTPAGAAFMNYVPNLFPKDSQRRPETLGQMAELLRRNDIIMPLEAIDGVLADGREMAGALPNINSLLAAGNDAKLQPLLAGMGIALADAKAILVKENKAALDMTDMLDLRVNDWTRPERGLAMRFRDVLANTFCSDLAMGDAVAKKDAAFLAANPDAFMALWAAFQQGNLPAAYMEDAITAVSAQGVVDKLRRQSEGSYPAFEQGAIAELQQAGAYVNVPVQADSFLSVLDERPYGMVGARGADKAAKAAFGALLEEYRDNPVALARFNKFMIGKEEDIYGDVKALARAIASTDDVPAALKAARQTGQVAPAFIGLEDPALLKAENGALVKFAVEHSSRDKEGTVTESSGVYKWLRDKERTKGRDGIQRVTGLSAILADMAGKDMFAKASPEMLYVAKDPETKKPAGHLVSQESFYQSQGWLRGAGAGIGEGLVGKTWKKVAPEIFPPMPFSGGRKKEGERLAPGKTMTAAQAEAAERQEEMTPRYPRAKMFVRPAQAVDRNVAADVEAFYASPVATGLNALFTEMRLTEDQKGAVFAILKNAAAYQALSEEGRASLQQNATAYNALPQEEKGGPGNAALQRDAARWAQLTRDAAAVKGSIELTLDANGAISTVQVKDKNRAMAKLRSRLNI